MVVAVVMVVEHGYLPYALIQLSCKGCCEKRERSLQPLWGARDFSFPPGVESRAGTREREERRTGGWTGRRVKEREREAYPFPFSPISPCRRVSLGALQDRPDRLPASQLGSHRAKPASQSGVRISLRGSNVSAEGLLDGSSSDNSQARRACCYTLECNRDVERLIDKESG